MLAVAGCFALGFMSAKPLLAQLNVEVKLAKEEYLQSDSDYQTALAAFNVDKQQYDKIPTNANFEVVLKSFRALIAARTRVWWAFFQAMKIDLAQLPTLTPDKAASMAAVLNQSQEKLQAENNALEALDSREELAAATAELKELSLTYPNLYYPILVQVKIAKMKLAHQKLTEFMETLAELIPQQILLTQDKEQRLRGLSDTTLWLAQVGEDLTKIEAAADAAQANQAYYLYDTSVKDMDQTYQQLLRAHTLLVELAAGLEL